MKMKSFLPKTKTFPIADEYVELQSVLEPESYFEWFLLIVDMFIQPLIMFLSWCLGHTISTISLVGTIARALQKWWLWIRYQVLRSDVRHWIFITKLAGGPFISCNDPKYHVFVYAEAIERLRLRGVSRSTKKSLSGITAAKE